MNVFQTCNIYLNRVCLSQNSILNALKAGAFSFSVVLLLNTRVLKYISGELVENLVGRPERGKLLLVFNLKC